MHRIVVVQGGHRCISIGGDNGVDREPPVRRQHLPNDRQNITDTIETNAATSMGFPCRVVARIVNIGSTSIVEDTDGPSQGMTINHNRTKLVARLLQCLAYDQLSCGHAWNSPSPVDVSGRDVVGKVSITINKRRAAIVHEMFYYCCCCG